VAEDVRTLSAELARDPASLVFVALAEMLRARGQLDSARKVVVAGLARHPALVEAHDLHARILSDAGDLAGAERAWHVVLEHNGRHLGARKGLGFVRYRLGDLDGALDHLEVALSIDPGDAAVVQALKTVRVAAEQVAHPSGDSGAPAALPAMADPTNLSLALPGATPAEAPRGSGRTTEAVFAGLEGSDQGMLLVDARGRVLGGGLQTRDGRDASATVAAHLAGVAQEAERLARILDLGAWTWAVAETSEGTLHLSQPAAGATLLLVRDRSVPAGRLAVLAEKAGEVAQRWLAAQVL
jgi:tetratricopeptide (TPR) repeat protein